MSKKNSDGGVARAEIPASLRARVNQLASRRGKEEADLVRKTCLQALQEMVDKGVPVSSLAEAFTAVEAAGGRISIYALPA